MKIPSTLGIDDGCQMSRVFQVGGIRKNAQQIKNRFIRHRERTLFSLSAKTKWFRSGAFSSALLAYKGNPFIMSRYFLMKQREYLGCSARRDEILERMVFWITIGSRMSIMMKIHH